MISLTIDLPEEAFSALRVDPNQFATELRFAAAVQCDAARARHGSR